MSSRMGTSVYFATRANLYRTLAGAAPNARSAESLLALANLFLNMSYDVRLIEETKELR